MLEDQSYFDATRRKKTKKKQLEKGEKMGGPRSQESR